MKSSCICLLLVPFCLFADKVVLNTAPAGDGVIYDRNKDGLNDTVSSTVIETKKANIAMVANSGWAWKTNYHAIFEFPLPEEFGKKKVGKAVLRLFFNGTAHQKIPKLEVFFYTAPQANGAVETSDFTGTSLGILYQGDSLPADKKIEFDVTEALKKIQGRKTDFIGFRISSPSKTDDQGAIIWRTSEFAEKYAGYAPTLILDMQ